MKKVATMLTVAGSDSAGGAGIQADCAAARSVGVFPICAVSCVTSQGRHGLRRLSPVDEDIFADQLEAAFEDFRPEAVKIGMLPSEKHIRILIDFLRRYRPLNVVLDPIMAPTSGGDEDVTKEMWRKPELLREIAPYTALFTPNLPEAKLILKSLKGADSTSEDDNPEDIIRRLQTHFRFNNILLKGGHGEGVELCDILLDPPEIFRHPKVATLNTHGTGCTLSSLIAARLALGEDMGIACRNSIADLHTSLQRNSDCDFYPHHGPHGAAFF